MSFLRKTKTVISNGSKTNFQMGKLRLHKATGVDSSGGTNDSIQHIYLGNNIDDNFFCVRFYAQDGITPLKHRRLNVASGVSADFIVLIPSMPAGGQISIFIDYAISGYSTESTDETLLNINVDGLRYYPELYDARINCGEPNIKWDATAGKFKQWGDGILYNANGGGPYGAPYNVWVDEWISLFSSVDGFTWTLEGEVVHPTDGAQRPGIYREDNGTVHMLVTPFYDPTRPGGGFDYWRSPSGNPGTFTLIQKNVISPGSTGSWDTNAAGNVHIYYENSTWYVLYEASSPNNNWTTGIASGPSLTQLTKYSGNPILSTASGQSFGGPEMYKINEKYCLFSHGWKPGNTAGSTLGLWTADNILGPYSWHSWLFHKPFPYGYGTGDLSQVGDVTVTEKDGKTYFYFTQNISQSVQPGETALSHMSLVTYDAPLSRLLDPVITTHRNDDLVAEGWVFDSGYGEYSPGTWKSETTYFRKRTMKDATLAAQSPPHYYVSDIMPVAICAKTDSTHQLKVRKLINTPNVENTFYSSARAEQTNKRFIPFRIDKDNTGGILAGVVFDSDGNLKYYNGAALTTIKAYVVGTYYSFKAKCHTSGYDLYVDDFQTPVATNIPYASAFAQPQYFYVEQAMGAEGYLGSLYTVQYSDAATEPTWGGTGTPSSTQAVYDSLTYDTTTLDRTTSPLVIPPAASTGQAYAPTAAKSVMVPVATSAGRAFAPKVISPVTVPVATSTGRAYVPVPVGVVKIPVATSTGQAKAPTAIRIVAVLAATSTGRAVAPIVTLQVSVIPAATSTGRAIPPRLVVTVKVPAATSTGRAYAPTLSTKDHKSPVFKWVEMPDKLQWTELPDKLKWEVIGEMIFYVGDYKPAEIRVSMTSEYPDETFILLNATYTWIKPDGTKETGTASIDGDVLYVWLRPTLKGHFQPLFFEAEAVLSKSGTQKRVFGPVQIDVREEAA